MVIGTRFDWGNWTMGWMGSYVVKEIQAKYVILVPYMEKVMIKNLLKKGHFIRDHEIKYTHKQLERRLSKGIEDLRITDQIIDLGQCTIIKFD